MLSKSRVLKTDGKSSDDPLGVPAEEVDSEAPSSWQADLFLRFEHKNNTTRLARCRHLGPLYVQKPFFPEGKKLPHIYLLHPPGGVVSGDCLRIDLDVGDDCGALFTTPGAGRVYRARPDNSPQGQHVSIDVGSSASAEWFPLENIVFPGANAVLSTTVRLAAGSQFLGWDVTSLGLPAQKADFNNGELSQRLEIWVDDCPKIIEHLRLSKSQALLGESVGLQRNPINATFVAGPFTTANTSDHSEERLAPVLEILRDIAEGERPVDSKSQCGVSLVNDFIVARYLGVCSESARQVFIKFWRVLRPLLLQRDACLPRIWST